MILGFTNSLLLFFFPWRLCRKFCYGAANKLSPFAKRGIKGDLRRCETVADCVNLPGPLFSKEGKS